MPPEAIIRDYLATHLELIDPNLTLLKKEFPVPNYQGSKGFIDLLAKDSYNNFIIIEIKRSVATSRQTIQEIIKYVGLLKQNFMVRDSEIKIIVLSTHWEELLVPFSELLYQTTLDAKGYKLTLDSTGIPIGKELITPTKITSERRISSTSFFHLFETEKKREVCIKYLEKRCKELNIKNYILVKLFNDKTRNPNLAFQYALCFAFQKLSINEYKTIIAIPDEDLDLQEDESENDEYIEYLEQEFLIKLDTDSYHDSAESGSPEKFDSILTIQNWKVEGTLCYGIFSTDPRYTDEMLILELKGWDGSSDIKYLSFGESSHIDRLNEVKENFIVPLINNEYWAKHLQKAFDYLQTLNKPYRFVIDVYQPNSVFDHIWRTITNHDMNYLPVYFLYVDFFEENTLWILGGRLSWNGSIINLDKFGEFLSDESDIFFNKFLDCIMGMHDEEILKFYELNYQNTIAKFKNDEIQTEFNIEFKDDKMVEFSNTDLSILEWLEENIELKDLLHTLYEHYTKTI